MVLHALYGRPITVEIYERVCVYAHICARACVYMYVRVCMRVYV